MKGNLRRGSLTIIFLLALSVAIPSVASAPVSNVNAGGQSGCGLRPMEMKPLVPLGCKDLVQACVCDNNGKNCHWAWVCVPL